MWKIHAHKHAHAPSTSKIPDCDSNNEIWRIQIETERKANRNILHLMLSFSMLVALFKRTK